MLLVLDVGNTNTVLGVYEAPPPAAAGKGSISKSSVPRLLAHWRVATVMTHTVDEYGVLFRNLFAIGKVDVNAVRGIIIASVVPPLDSTLREVCERYLQLKPLFVEPGIKTGMPVLYDNPQEVGADRIVNGVAAFEKYGGPCVVVDLGTATTFDAVSRKGEYLGGIISPGIGISARALYEHTARLPLVDIRKPAKVIGTNTVGSIQAGLFFGYLGLVDGILERLISELGPDTNVVATGGLASLIGDHSKYIKNVDDLLTLDGLRIIWERNAATQKHKPAS
ncbi:MAG TPA: type III pantothenate kinase [Candidatus Angelobacter sp.]|jgi:type III pantothenate kinase